MDDVQSRLDRLAVETVTPERAVATETPIEAGGVLTLESSHADSQVRMLRFDEQVVVRRQQAVRQDIPAQRRGRTRKECQKATACGAVRERGERPDRVAGDVMDEAGSLDPRLSWHR